MLNIHLEGVLAETVPWRFVCKPLINFLAGLEVPLPLGDQLLQESRCRPSKMVVPEPCVRSEAGQVADKL